MRIYAYTIFLELYAEEKCYISKPMKKKPTLFMIEIDSRIVTFVYIQSLH